MSKQIYRIEKTIKLDVIFIMYTWVLLHNAGDVTIICPSIRGMNKMLEICNIFSKSNHTYFNAMNAICFKFGEEHEKTLTKEKELS